MEYTLRTRAGECHRIKGDGQDHQARFLNATERLGISQAEAISFFAVGKAFSQTSKISEYQSVTMWDREPGEELILSVRGLPRISEGAAYILRYDLPANRAVSFSREDYHLHPAAETALEELIERGLAESCGDGETARYQRTEAGQDYPVDAIIAPRYVFPHPLILRMEDWERDHAPVTELDF